MDLCGTLGTLAPKKQRRRPHMKWMRSLDLGTPFRPECQTFKRLEKRRRVTQIRTLPFLPRCAVDVRCGSKAAAQLAPFDDRCTFNCGRGPAAPVRTITGAIANFCWRQNPARCS